MKASQRGSIPSRIGARWLALAVGFSLCLLAWLGLHVEHSYRVGRALAVDFASGEHIRHDIANLDHELRALAQMAITARDVDLWSKKHADLAMQLTRILDEAIQVASGSPAAKSMAEIAAKRSLLTATEREAIDQARAGRMDSAHVALASNSYETRASELERAIGRYHREHRAALMGQLRSAHDREVVFFVVALTVFGISFGIWLFLVRRSEERHAAWVRELHERTRAEHDLAEAATKYRDLFEHANDAIFIIDHATHRFLDFNQRALQWLGYSREELSELRIEDVDAESQNTRDAVQPLHEGEHASLQTTLCARKGQEIRVAVTSQLIRFDGRLAYQYAARDVTPCHTLEEQLLQSQRMESMGQLACGIAHEFGNLAMTISGYLSLLRRSIDGDPRGIEAVERMESVAAESRRVAHGLLTFAGRSSIDRRPVDVRRVVTKCGRLLQTMFPPSIQLSIDCDSQAPLWVKADRTQLEQVLLALALNARDAMPDGGQLSVRCSCSCCTPGAEGGCCDPGNVDVVRIVVTDTGAGMSPDILSRIWDPFFTTKPKGRGTGLGLSIVHGIVSDCHGRIQVRSDPGQGTTFVIELPALNRGEIWTESHRSGDELPAGNGELVALAFGHRYVGEITATALRTAGYTVHSSSNLRALLRTLRSHQGETRLVLMDDALPGTDGPRGVRAIVDAARDAPCIFVVDRLDLEFESTLEGQLVLLPRPYDMADLEVLVSNIIAPRAQGVGA